MAIAPTPPLFTDSEPRSGAEMVPLQRFVRTGEVVFTKQPMVLTTVLGSCISVCLFDRRKRWGGMNHFVHACSAGDAPVDNHYGAPAIASLIDRFLMAGSRLTDLEARIAGGGHVLRGLSMRMGDRNIDEAIEQLSIWSVDLVGHDVGGNWTRRVWYDTHSGRVRCRRTTNDSQEAYTESMRLLSLYADSPR